MKRFALILSSIIITMALVAVNSNVQAQSEEDVETNENTYLRAGLSDMTGFVGVEYFLDINLNIENVVKEERLKELEFDYILSDEQTMSEGRLTYNLNQLISGEKGEMKIDFYSLPKLLTIIERKNEDFNIKISGSTAIIELN